jgi:ribosomal protein S1
MSKKSTKKSNKPTSSAASTGSINIMDRLLGTQQMPVLRKGEEVETKIITISKKGVMFDLGSKAYAVLGDREVREISTYLPYLNPGDTVKVRIIAEESKEGYPVVSMSRFFEKGKWSILHEKKENEDEIEVICGEYGKGGVFIDFMGIRGVIPKIQLTQEYIDHAEKLTGQKIKVKVLEVDETKNRLVVSQKASALGISQKDLKVKFEKIKVGDVYEANVLGVSEFGIFCEVDGVEGLVHISEISWEKVSDASSYVRPNEVIKVMVVEKNENDLKLNLSIKRLSDDPWKMIEETYPKDKELEGEIIRKEHYGYFVRLAPGVEGLIHVSKLSGDEKIELGDKIKVYVERVNKKDRKMSLVLPIKAKPVMYR